MPSARKHEDIQDNMPEMPPQKRSRTPEEDESHSTSSSAGSELAHVERDPHSDAVHAEWDMAILAKNLVPGAELLSAIVSQCSFLDQAYVEYGEAKKLYDSESLLSEELEKCYAAKSFRRIRTLLVLQGPLSTEERITKFLKDHADVLSSYASGEVLLTEWTPPLHSRINMHIPGGYTSEKPDLLIDEIGEWSKAGGIMTESISQVFRNGRPTFVFNASGTGKTRVLLEGLCHRWGLYFSCAVDSQSHHGSSDITKVIGRLGLTAGFSTPVPLGEPVHAAVRENRKLTERGLLRVFLARLIVLECYLMDFPRVTTVEDFRRRWLLLQVFPEVVGSDMFDGVSTRLEAADIDFMKTKIKDTFANIKKMLPQGETLFAVFDEAQYAAQKYSEAFVSDDYKAHTPFLGEIIETWEAIAPEVTMVVSGTCPFTDVRRNSESSPIGAPNGWSLFTSTGAFDNQEAQEQYILRYVWPDVKEKKELPHREQVLLDRAWRWLRGRYRSTVTFVSMLLRVDTRAAHPLLNYYYHHVAKFDPTDCLEFSDTELSPSAKDMVETFVPNDFCPPGQPRLWDNIFQVHLRSLFRSETYVSSPDREQFVRVGVARICEPANSRPKDIHLDEPMVLMSLSKQFHTVQLRDRSGCHSAVKTPRTNDYSISLPETIAFYFRSILDGELNLDEIVEFIGGKPHWANKPARLITVIGRNSGGTLKTCTVGPMQGPSPIVATRSHDKDDTLRWLREPNGVAFCFPDASFGVDILFLIEVGGRYIWVTVRSYLHGRSESTEKEDPARAGQSPEPDSRKNKGKTPLASYSCPVPPELKAFSFDTTGRQKRGGRVTRGDHESILRLIAAYPTRPDATSLTKLTKESPCPLAFVNMKRFLQNLRPLIPQIDQELTG
ncbi:hypothetical protein BD410DRAFT_783557 [Rickenella mellea]|uniref:Uncharacterized protein n=1 Tax=Rickenella mellea TaxID=50990 RepID=A0A4Y7QI60_9AGAM|nr:hypothetical protein BD410DRAFT_783557 [Rickenella mellea]